MSILFALLALLVFFGPLILALSAFYKAKNVERQTTKAERSLEALTSRVAKLTSELESLGNSPGPDGPAKPKMEKAPTPVVQEKDDAVTEPPYPKVPKRSAFPPETRTMPSPWPPKFAHRPITAKSVEEALTSRWLVWLGAVALAQASALEDLALRQQERAPTRAPPSAGPPIYLALQRFLS